MHQDLVIWEKEGKEIAQDEKKNGMTPVIHRWELGYDQWDSRLGSYQVKILYESIKFKNRTI